MAFGWLPGASEQDIIDRELANGDLNNRGTGFADRSGSWNWQDNFGAWLAGTSKEKVLAGAKKKRDRQLNEKFAADAATNSANLGPLSATYTGAEGRTPEEMRAALNTDAARAKALQVAIGDGELDVGTLSSNASVGQILGANTKAKKYAAEQKRLLLEKERKAEVTETREYNRGLVEETREYNKGLLAAANLRADKKEERQLLREDRKDARARLERLETRKMNMELRSDEMKFKYAQLAQQDRQSRQDKKDRAMMALIQGLGNLGAAFTV